MTPSQTVGPFFSHALPWREGPYVVPLHASGSVWIRGRVLDGAGEPVPDALIESWQSDPDGHYDTPGFRGFGRCPTDAEGTWHLHTVKPGRVEGQAPHIALSVFARGLLSRVVTRIYFPDEAEANAADPVLSSIPEPDRARLVAKATEDGYVFDIHLQGPDETVFFQL